MLRVIPDIPRIKAHWDRRSSVIPTYLDVPMSDGSCVTYVPEINQSAQQVQSALQNIRNLSNMKNGYRSENDESIV
jgi:hypothetical protein